MNLVSVIVPIYNVEDYILRCYKSLLSQTYKNIEIISVIDGSTDNSEKIVRELMNYNHNIRIINKENGGLSSARNEGLKYAVGDYVIFVDPDDWLDENVIERCVEEAIKENADVVFFPYIKEFSNKSIKLSFFNGKKVFDEYETKHKLYRRFFGLYKDELKFPDRIDQFSTVTCKFYRKKVIDGIRFVDTKIIGTEDAFYNILVFKNVNRTVYIEDIYYHYFKDNNTSLTNTYKKDLFAQWSRLYSLMYSHIIENDLSNDYKEALNNRICLNQLQLSLNIVNSKLPFIKKNQELRSFLCSEIYTNSYKDFDFSYFDIKWKIFYKCCKNKQTFFVYILCLFAETVRRHRNS